MSSFKVDWFEMGILGTILGITSERHNRIPLSHIRLETLENACKTTNFFDLNMLADPASESVD